MKSSKESDKNLILRSSNVCFTSEELILYLSFLRLAVWCGVVSWQYLHTIINRLVLQSQLFIEIINKITVPVWPSNVSDLLETGLEDLGVESERREEGIYI